MRARPRPTFVAALCILSLPCVGKTEITMKTYIDLWFP